MHRCILIVTSLLIESSLLSAEIRRFAMDPGACYVSNVSSKQATDDNHLAVESREEERLGEIGRKGGGERGGGKKEDQNRGKSNTTSITANGKNIERRATNN